MFEPILALGLLVTAPQAPPVPVPVVIERHVGSVLVRRLADGTVFVSPGFSFEFDPGADAPGSPPRWLELVAPAGARREFSARSETLLTVPRGVALELYNMAGNIRVEGWDKDVVRVVAQHDRSDRFNIQLELQRRRDEAARNRAEAARRRAAELARRSGGEVAGTPPPAGLAGGTLQIETLDRRGIPAAADYTITVPQWMVLRLSGMESDISVEGVRAAIEAESVRGSVEVRGARGPLQLSSVEGAVRAFDCDGGLEASSINDEIELADVSGALVVESVNGDIRIARAKSRNVEASTVNGSVIFRGAFEPRGRYRLASHAGNLVVGVPVGAGVDVSVATFEGGFSSAFPLEIGPWRKGQKFNFVLGDGGSSLELESFLGEIQLLRPAEVPAAATAPRAPRGPGAPHAPKAGRTHRAPAPPSAPEPEEDR